MFYLPKKQGAKIDARWKFGIFIGRAMASDQNIIALSDGSVTRARAMCRVTPQLALGCRQAAQAKRDAVQ